MTTLLKKIIAVTMSSAIGLTAVLPVTSFAQTAAKRSNATPPAKPPFPSMRFNNPANGENAVRQLGDKLPAVAAHYGKTPDELRNILRKDKSAWIDKEGRLFYVEEGLTDSGSDLAPSGAIYPLDQTFQLHSRPSSKRKLLLDFDGHTTTGTATNTSYGIDPIINPPFDLDGVPGTFNTTELAAIQNIWRRVAEDYAPFDVDVTTQEPTADQLRRTSVSDDAYGIRTVITKNFTAGTKNGDCGCGGFAYVGVIDSTSETYKVSFVFHDKLSNREKSIAEAASHEIGHTAGLQHDGTSTLGYYRGHGTGATGWAPIMGVGYSRQLVQFSKGEYLDANNKEDDFLVMQNNGVVFAADDFGNTPATATALTPTPANGMNTYDIRGLIETPSDVDTFKFASAAGTITIDAKPFERSPNLDILIQLRDANGVLVAESNPVDLLTGTLTVNAPATGAYYLSIQGTGKGDPLSLGYSSYGSLGRYTMSVSAPIAAGLPTAAITTNVTSGTSPLTVSFSGAASADSAGNALTYEWNFGDGSAPATGVTASHTYTAAGSYNATLTVTTATGLTDMRSVTITVTSPQPKVFASSIVMSTTTQKNRQTYAQAVVTVKDLNGKPVPGASVTGTWSGVVNATGTVVTDANGVATARSPQLKQSGTFRYTINGIAAGGYAYDASLNTMTSNAITH